MEQYNANGKKQCMGCMEFYGAAYDICPHCGYEEGQPAEALLHIDPGTLLANRYIIGRALGSGGFGVTYMAWDTQLKRKLAIKEYLPSEFATRMIHQQNLIVANNEKIRQQYTAGMKKFLNEGQKLAQVRNVDGIVHMYDCFEANNTAYITMEYLEGETLAEFLEREGPVSEKDAMDFVMPVLQALEAVHEKGIIHRDIAPDNLFLARDTNGDIKVKLIDFGAAKFATTSHSKSLTVIIKPGYSPEEQYRSNGDQGTYTDVYALAAVLYRMVTGVQPPDAFERRTMIETKKKDLLEEPSRYNRDLSVNFENALLNAMNVRIEDRTATVADFEEELISFEPVKRRGSSIRRLDFNKWPLWAKIAVPLGSLAAIALLIWGLIVAFTDPETTYELPEGMTRVPDFVTADFAQAQAWADEAVLLIGSTGTEYVPNAAENIVLSQDVYSGAVVLENTMVSVIVSTGEESYALPDVTGMSVEYAQRAMECMGLEIIIAPCDQADGLAAGCVVSQDIKPYTEVQTGDTITITVTDAGSGNAGTAPNLVGLSYKEALKAASEAGVVLRVTEKVFTDDYADTQILSQSVKDGTALKAEDVVEVTMAVSMRQFSMPNLLYKPLNTAIQLLKNIGIDADIEKSISEIIAKDLVAGQSVEKEQNVVPGDAVTLTVSSGSKPFAMPNVVGKTEAEARKILTDSALVVRVEYDYDPAVPEDCVISQSEKEDTAVTRGTSVSIVVCSKKDLVEVPAVKGKTADEAKRLLEENGLVVQIVEEYGTDDDTGLVIKQEPGESTYQKAGTTIVLTVSKGARRTEVPNVVGMSKNSAISELKAAGFGVRTEEVYDTDSTKGKVIRQSPEAGTNQIYGTTVTLKISKGAKPAPTEPPTEDVKKPATYTASWDSGTGYTITVKRTASPNANASIGTLSSPAIVYHGDVLSITYTANAGFTISSKGSTSITVTGDVTSSNIYANATVNSYTASWSGGTGYSIEVHRTSSPNKGASTGVLSSGATVYYGDVLAVTYAASAGYRIESKGSTSITVTGNVTSAQIFATVTQDTCTYNIVYKSTNGTALGTSTATYAYGTTNTISAPAKSGYDTPASQTVTWDSISPKTITFVYTPSYVATSQYLVGSWWWESSQHPGTGVSYSVNAEYKNRTANSVEVRIVWTQTIKQASYGFNQYFNCSLWHNGANVANTGSVQIASTSTWPYYGPSGPWHTGSVTAYSDWRTVSLNTTNAAMVGVACDWWTESSSQSGSWSGKNISIPAY